MESASGRTQRRLGGLLNQLSPGEASASSLQTSVCSAKGSAQTYANLPDISDGPETLKRERAAASFDVSLMTTVLDGSETLTQLKSLVAATLENDEILNDKNRYDLSRPEARIRTMAKIKQIMELKRSGAGASAKAELELRTKDKDAVEALDKDKTDSAPTEMEEAFYWAMSQSDAGLSTRMGVHFGLFANAIAGQAAPELKNKLWDDIQYMRITGCFAMTELGHGSYIRGFETTSTYDLKNQEFVINSPTLTSTKWWIGMAGQTATHAVVFARLLLPQKDKGGELKDYGVHSFLVQLRCTETGRPLPGIRIGDCGAKMGRNGLDNGWIQFHSVRIPREHMLMRWAQVSPEGNYFNPPKPQLSYGALISGRVSIVNGSAEAAKKALTIAIRYAAIRRQFPSPSFASGDQSVSASSEMQILDYQSTQYRLMPLIAGAYAFHFTSVQMKKHFNAVQKEMNSDDFELSSLNTLHATSAGLKAFSTWWANAGIEQCRQSLGGQGYSAYSGLASLLADFGVMCTWEGDNTVLAQQTARYLLGAVTKARKGERVDGFTAYLAGGAETLKESAMTRFPARTAQDLLNPQFQLLAHRRLSIGLIVEAAHRLDEETAKNGGSKSEAWNECMVDLVRAARAHCYYYVVYCFAEAVRELENGPEAVKKGVAAALKRLNDLFALHNLESQLGELLEMGYFTPHQAQEVRNQTRALSKEVRKDAVPFVDAFNFPDFLLNSPLGAFDGDIYKHYFQTVLEAPNSESIPYWDELIKPLVTKKQ